MDKDQAKRISTIYNRSVQSKAEIREEGDAALQSFLRSGGSIQVVKASRRKTGSKMTGKTSKGFQAGTSGFATGYPRRSLA